MTFDHVKDGNGEPVVGNRWRLAAGAVTIRAEAPARGLRLWFQLFVLRRYADAMLKRTLRRRRRSNLEELSPYLLRDIGLPPDARR